MEGINKKPIIIEFNGLPGSGKTTIAKALKMKLESLNYDSLLWYDKSKLLRNPRLFFFMPQYWSALQSAFSYSKLLPNRNYTNRILTTITFIRMYHGFVNSGRKDVLLRDQGIVQSIVSWAHTDLLPDSERLTDFLNLMHLEDLPLLIVNCHVSEVVSNSRIEARPFNGCRVETMDKSDRLKTLEVQTTNFSFIRDVIKNKCQKLKIIDINTDMSIEDNVNLIIKQVS